MQPATVGCADVCSLRQHFERAQLRLGFLEFILEPPRAICLEVKGGGLTWEQLDQLVIAVQVELLAFIARDSNRDTLAFLYAKRARSRDQLAPAHDQIENPSLTVDTSLFGTFDSR